MRGQSKSPPKYRKHKASGQAIVTISGTMFYLGPFGTKASKIKYDQLIGEWLANGRQASFRRKSEQSFTIAQLCAEYWRFCKTYYKGRSTGEQAGVKAAINCLVQLYDSTDTEDFGPLSLEAVRERMIEAGNSRRYINQNIGRIKRMFKWGVSKELISVEVHQRLQTVTGLRKGKSKAVETDPVLPVSDEIVHATIFYVNDTVADMIRIQRLTGCRPGEICAMRPVDIDRANEVWQFWPESHKMEHRNRSRVILIGPQAQSILAKYLLRRGDQHCFLRNGDRPFKTLHYYQHVKRGCDKAFPPPQGMHGEQLKIWRKTHRWAPNRLRHTAGTEIRAKFGIEATQVVLGHSKVETSQVYAERDLEKAAKIMAEVG